MRNNQNSSHTPAFHSPRNGEIHPTLLLLSTSVLVYLRINIGYRLVDGRALAFPFLLHLILGYITYHAQYLPDYARQGGLAMMIYAAGILVLSGVHSRRGMRLAFREPNPVHSMSLGDSLFLYSYMFRRLRLGGRAAGTCELLSLVSLGAFFGFCLRWYLLGWWLIASAICLACVETIVQFQMQNALLDLRDSRSELQDQLKIEERVVSAVNDPSASAAQQHPVSRSAVATLSPELEWRRRE